MGKVLADELNGAWKGAGYFFFLGVKCAKNQHYKQKKLPENYYFGQPPLLFNPFPFTKKTPILLYKLDTCQLQMAFFCNQQLLDQFIFEPC